MIANLIHPLQQQLSTPLEQRVELSQLKQMTQNIWRAILERYCWMM